MVWQLEQREETYANSQESWLKPSDWIPSVIQVALGSLLIFVYCPPTWTSPVAALSLLIEQKISSTFPSKRCASRIVCWIVFWSCLVKLGLNPAKALIRSPTCHWSDFLWAVKQRCVVHRHVIQVVLAPDPPSASVELKFLKSQQGKLISAKSKIGWRRFAGKERLWPTKL